MESGSVTAAISGPTSEAHSGMIAACSTRSVSPDCVRNLESASLIRCGLWRGSLTDRPVPERRW
jgi:hypothetical protein